MPQLRSLRDNIAFVLVALLEVVLIGAVLFGIFAFERETERRAASRETLSAIDRTLIALLDAETGERGYVLSGDASFLDPYRDARARLGDVLSELSDVTAGEPAQARAVKDLGPLIGSKLDTMEASIEARLQGSEQAGEDEIVSGNGRQLMDEIRVQLGTMRDREASRLQDHIDGADRIGRFIGISSVTLAVASIALVGWLFFSLRRQQSSEQLRKVAEAKDEFVGFVSHELRSPISIIAGNVRLLEGDLDPPERELAISEITGAADRLHDIIETLLSLSRAEAGERLDVEPILVQRVMQRAANAHHARFPETDIELDAPDNLEPALGDGRAVEQVLLNLMSNAEKYGDGRSLKIRASHRGDYIEVAVDNLGPKLESDTFTHVFEPFFRSPASAATAPGIGLGLTVCHRLVIAQGGRMAAFALPEGGASFRFTLLVAPNEDVVGA